MSDPIPAEARVWLRQYLHDEGVDLAHNVTAMENEILAGLTPIITAQATADLRAGIEALRDEIAAASPHYAVIVDRLDALLRGAK